MTESNASTQRVWLDPADDAPELTDEILEIAAFKVGDRVIARRRAIWGRTAWCTAGRRRAGWRSGR